MAGCAHSMLCHSLAAPPPEPGGSETKCCGAVCRRWSAPPWGHPARSIGDSRRSFSADLRGRCRGSRGCVAWWARSRASAGIGSGGRSVSEGGAEAVCARGGAHRSWATEGRLHQSTGPRHLGLPAQVTSDRHVRILARPAKCPKSPLINPI